MLKSTLAKSSENNYRRYYSNFLDYLAEIGVSVQECAIEHVLDFLAAFVEENYAFSTVRTVSAAIKYYFERSGKESLFDCNPYFDFLRGAQRLCPIPQKPVEIWNPLVVLAYVAAQPVPTDFLSAATEASLLIALATGFRVDCIWKLGKNVDFRADCVTVYFLEKRKCPVNKVYTASQSIKRYTPNKRICPVKALHRFVRFANKIRHEGELFLFVSSLGQRASKATIRRWICAILFSAGITASAGSCRSATSSFAAFKGVPTDIILQSAGWSSECTFRRYYNRPVRSVAINLYDFVSNEDLESV